MTIGDVMDSDAPCAAQEEIRHCQSSNVRIGRGQTSYILEGTCDDELKDIPLSRTATDTIDQLALT